jgi:hypothetical protein
MKTPKQKFHVLAAGPESRIETRMLVRGRWMRLERAKQAAAQIVAQEAKEARMAAQERWRAIVG